MTEITEESRRHDDVQPAFRRPPWTFLDILLVLATGLVGIVLLLIVGVVAVQASGVRPSVGAALLVGGAATYGVFVLATWYFALHRRGAGWQALGCRTVRGRGVTATILAAVLATPVILLALLLLEGVAAWATSLLIGQFNNPQTESLAPGGVMTTSNFVLVLIAAAVVAPVAEELLFRGLIYRYLRGKMGVLGAVLISASVFSAAHVIPQLFPVLFVAGVALALTAEYFESIYPAMALHALHNGLAVVVLYFSLR